MHHYEYSFKRRLQVKKLRLLFPARTPEKGRESSLKKIYPEIIKGIFLCPKRKIENGID
jgi:hypothetical protein